MNKNQWIKRISFDAIFAALAVVLYCFGPKFKLATIFPSFLEINFSMVPIIILAFMLGPWDAALAVLVRMIIKFMVGTGTMGVGELADLLIGLLCCLPAGLIYHESKFKHKTLFAFISVVIMWVLGGIFTNIFINIPFYKAAFKMSDEALAGMISTPISAISFGLIKADSITPANYMFYYILFSIIPFNLMLGLAVTLITAPIHVRLKSLYDMINIVMFQFD